MNEKYFLAKFDFDYGDEFNVEGFNIITENEIAEDSKYTEKCATLFPDWWNQETEWYYGTNEFVMISPKDLYKCLMEDDIIEIPEDEAKAIIKHLGWGSSLCNFYDSLFEDIFKKLGIDEESI